MATNQYLFAPGRQSLDNVIICQEVIHTLRYTQSSMGGMVLKIDLEKAYNMKDWGFLEDTLRDASLPQNIVTVFMNLIRKSSCRLLWNGEETEVIKPSCWLRQSDHSHPISPSSALNASDTR